MEFLILHMFVSIGKFKFGERRIFLWFGVLISYAEKFQAVINIATGINEIFYLIAGSDSDSSVIILEDLRTIKNVLNHMESSISAEFEGIENMLLHLDTTTIIQNWKLELSVGIQIVQEVWIVFTNYMGQPKSTLQRIMTIYVSLCERQSEFTAWSWTEDIFYIELESFHQPTIFYDEMIIGHNMVESYVSIGKLQESKQLNIFGTCYDRMRRRCHCHSMSCDRDIDRVEYLDECILKKVPERYHWTDDNSRGRVRDHCKLKGIINFSGYCTAYHLRSVDKFSRGSFSSNMGQNKNVPAMQLSEHCDTVLIGIRKMLLDPEGRRMANDGTLDLQIRVNPFEYRTKSIHGEGRNVTSSLTLNQCLEHLDLVLVGAVTEECDEDSLHGRYIEYYQSLYAASIRALSNATDFDPNSMSALSGIDLLYEDNNEARLLDMQFDSKGYFCNLFAIVILQSSKLMMEGGMICSLVHGTYGITDVTSMSRISGETKPNELRKLFGSYMISQLILFLISKAMLHHFIDINLY